MTDTSPLPSPRHDTGLLCPVCRVDLVMTDRQGVEIDYCPKCRGVWLDRGELDKIIERSAAYEAGLAQTAPTRETPRSQPPASQPWGSEPARDYGGKHGGGERHGGDRHGGGHGGHGGGRRRGFLGGLFDD